jgi:hypothetical protein
MINSSDEPTGRLALVFELMEMNLYEAIKGNNLFFSTFLVITKIQFLFLGR